MNPLRGRCRTCWLAVQGFNSSHPPCQGLPWRNIIPLSKGADGASRLQAGDRGDGAQAAASDSRLA